MTESEFARCYMTHIVLPQAQNRGEQGATSGSWGHYTRAKSDNPSALVLSGIGFRHWLNED